MFCSICLGGYVAQPTGRTGSPSNKNNSESHFSRRTAATAWVLNESTYKKSYDGLEVPLGQTPVCSLKLLLCKAAGGATGCFFLLFFACGCKFGTLGRPLCPQGTARTSGRPSCHIAVSTTQVAMLATYGRTYPQYPEGAPRREGRARTSSGTRSSQGLPKPALGSLYLHLPSLLLPPPHSSPATCACNTSSQLKFS
jgi:hypothetical protein